VLGNHALEASHVTLGEVAGSLSRRRLRPLVPNLDAKLVTGIEK